jgi:acetyl esterase/lipase
MPLRLETIGGVTCHIVGVEEAVATVLYFHGGGYRLGEPATWLGFAARLAAEGDIRIILPDYRLAPEHPFPAAVHDAASVYMDVRKARAGPLIVAGDSAGGGLAASLVALAQANGDRGPDGLIMLSPWLDLSVTAETYGSHAAQDRMFSRDSATEAAGLYLQGESPDQPLASPINADLSTFPPVQLFCGGQEVLLGDSLAFAAKLALAGGSIEAHFVSAMQHVWPMVEPEIPESDALRRHVVRFARSVAASVS